MRWPRRVAIRRLYDITGVVPLPSAGSQSAATAGFVGYARDMAVVQAIARAVLRADLTPAPHPEWGDDGARDEAITDALAALDWGEAWLLRRSSENWSTPTSEDVPWSWSAR